MSLDFSAKQKLGAFTLDASFTAGRGVTALFGRSGSGKTSVIRIIAGLTRPDEGRVAFEDSVLIDRARRMFVPIHKRRFGYVFQDALLFPHLSVRQNLNYGRWFAPKGAAPVDFARVVEMLGIGELMDRAPARLSGGERQRVAIGRALLSAPRLLLMDEPLAALDEARKAEILPFLERLRDDLDIPVIYVSHSVSEVVRLAGQVVMLDAGKVVAVGSPSDVLSTPGAALGREFGVVIDAVSKGYDAHYGLAVLRLGPVDLRIPSPPIPEGQGVRLHIPARDVMLATARPSDLSALNVIEAIVRGISEPSGGMVDVTLDCAGTAIVARITALSVTRLGLAENQAVFALIKAVAIDRS